MAYRWEARILAERLTAADAFNFELDARDHVNAFLMAGVLASGGCVGLDGEVDLDTLRRALAERVPAVPRLAQRVRRAGRVLVWEPVRLDLAAHVRQVAAVEGRAGFEALCARLVVTPLPLHRPLWELLVVPGVAPARAGIVLRVHHTMADGVATVRLAQALMDPVASDLALDQVADSADPASDRVTDSADLVGGDVESRGVCGRGRAVVSGVSRTIAFLRRAVPPTVLLGRVGRRRAVAFVDVDLGRLAAGARTAGATVNDALLVAAGAAARSALLARGEEVPDVLPASVPVALPHRGRSGNATGVMLVPMPAHEADLARRLRSVAGLTRAAKDDARSRGTYELTRTRLGTWVFPRLARRQRLIVMFVTNVRGPRRPLALAGARVERIWPVAALGGNVRLGVAAISYDGVLRCAVHCDADALPAAVVARALGDELAEIAALG
ncbi:wax ester/triacylglycerol synthase domain-containing protein [Promicromonospora sp. NPDC059942]|uniref:wax ester/triacylglycerol synthase domain-containing protein n=1 Tax=Promicromonospora sp. NPDC059942 TaxID=3347009 RepID=UPI0036536945